LIEALRRYFKYADEIIYATAKGHQHVDIWSSAEDDELELLANAWLVSGRRNAKAARRVRTTVSLSENFIAPAMITVPRMIATVQHYIRSGGISLS
jgi:hypothetical protein